MEGLWSLGASVYTMSIVIVTIKLGVTIHCKSYTLFHALSFLVSITFWFFFIYLLSLYDTWIEVWTNMKAEGINLFATPQFLLLLVLCPVTACLPDVTMSVFNQRSSPIDSQIMREIERGYRNGKNVKNELGFVERVTDISVRQAEEVGVAAALEEATSHQVLQQERDMNRATNSEVALLPRTLTWHEVVNEEEIEGIDHINSLSRHGHRRSSGFRVSMSHTDAPATVKPGSVSSRGICTSTGHTHSDTLISSVRFLCCLHFQLPFPVLISSFSLVFSLSAAM